MQRINIIGEINEQTVGNPRLLHIYRRDGACPVSPTRKTPTFEQDGGYASSPHNFPPSTFPLSTISYLPYGESFVSQRLAGEPARYTFSAKEKDVETGYSYFGARYYSSDLSVWLSVDPLSDEFPHQTPYAYCNNNPVILVDPDGRSPIYSLRGEFLGTDNNGLQGSAIMMSSNIFEQGMSPAIAASVGKTLDFNINYPNCTNDAKVIQKIESHFNGLSSRPDFDGMVTIEEGIKWAKEHPNAISILRNDPNEALYINASLLDLGSLSSENFKNGVGKSSPINTLNLSNLISAGWNSDLRNSVYALGRVDAVLYDSGNFSILNNEATTYDWNTGGNLLRSTLIKLERVRADINNAHGFYVRYYGVGKLDK